MNIYQLREEFEKVYVIEDKALIPITMAMMVGNRLRGNPIWMLLIGPPSCGKTAAIDALSTLKFTRELSSLTSKTFLSGYTGRDRASFLHQVSYGDLLSLKEFSTVLSLPNEERQGVIAQLREVYDGKMRRQVGTGDYLTWDGKLGFIAGATEAADTQLTLHRLMGERFLQFRIKVADYDAITDRAMENADMEAEYKIHLAECTRRWYKSLEIERRFGDPAKRKVGQPMPRGPELLPKIDDEARQEIKRWARLAAVGRSPIPRAGGGEIIAIPQPETPARLSIQLIKFAQAFEAFEFKEYVPILQRVCANCLPPRRYVLLQSILDEGELTVVKASDILQASLSASRRHLEDLALVGVFESRVESDGRTRVWTLHERYRETLESRIE